MTTRSGLSIRIGVQTGLGGVGLGLLIARSWGWVGEITVSLSRRVTDLSFWDGGSDIPEMAETAVRCVPERLRSNAVK